MSGAMHIVYASREALGVRKESLPISKHRRVYRRCDPAIQVVIGHDFDQLGTAARQGNSQWKNLMVAMAPAVLRAR